MLQCDTDYADWPVRCPPTAEQVSQVGAATWRCVKGELASIPTAVASTPPSAAVSTTRRTVERVRRAISDRSTVSRSHQTSLTQSFERRRRLYCGLCRVKMNADQQAEQHFAGKLHARKSKMMTRCQAGEETSAPWSRVADTHVRTIHLIGLI